MIARPLLGQPRVDRLIGSDIWHVAERRKAEQLAAIRRLRLTLAKHQTTIQSAELARTMAAVNRAAGVAVKQMVERMRPVLKILRDADPSAGGRV